MKLPPSNSKPPKKTTTKLAKETFERLSKIELESFKRDVRQLGDKMLEVRYATKERPYLAAVISISPCFDCVPMDVAKWQQKKDSLKVFLVPELREHKETVFEVGGNDLFGAKFIFTYQLGWAFGKDPENDQPMGAYSHAYVAYYNDGVNQIRVQASYADDPVKTRDEMVALAPKEDLEKIAKRFLEHFTNAWVE